MPSDIAECDGGRDSYRIGRGLRPSARLTAQHSLLRAQFGWLLHPSVQESVEKKNKDSQLRVADIGTGNGIWACDLSNWLSSAFPDLATAIDGLDISPTQFPPPSLLPQNVDLATLDIKSPVPTHLLEKYDIIHVRYFCLAATAEEIPGIFENLNTLLSMPSTASPKTKPFPEHSVLKQDSTEPGGYVQWVERNYHARQRTPTVPTPEQTGWQRMTEYMRACYPSFGWIPKLRDFLPGAGFEVMHHSSNPPPLWMQHAYDENVLCAFLDFAESITDPEQRGEFQRWVEQAYEECKNGFTHDWTAEVVVGRRI